MAFRELEIVACCNESVEGKGRMGLPKESGKRKVIPIHVPRGQAGNFAPLIGREISQITALGNPPTNLFSSTGTTHIEVLEEA